MKRVMTKVLLVAAVFSLLVVPTPADAGGPVYRRHIHHGRRTTYYRPVPHYRVYSTPHRHYGYPARSYYAPRVRHHHHYRAPVYKAPVYRSPYAGRAYGGYYGRPRVSIGISF